MQLVFSNLYSLNHFCFDSFYILYENFTVIIQFKNDNIFSLLYTQASEKVTDRGEAEVVEHLI